MVVRFVRIAVCMSLLLCLPAAVLADGAISGRIVDSETGEGVRCPASFYSGVCGENYQGQVWSENNGDYTMTGLPAGQVYIRLIPGNAGHTDYVNEYYNGAPTCAEATPVVIVDGETITLDLPLHHPSGGGSISGVINDSSGNPLSNLRVYAYTGKCGSGYISYGVTYTAADGTYLLEHLPVGDIYVKACPTCTTGFTQANQWWTSSPSNTLDCNAAEPIPVTEGSVHNGTDFILTSGGTITGTLTRPDSSPVYDNIVVHAYLDDPCNGEYAGAGVAGFSGSPGGYIIDQLPAGTIYVRTDSHTRPADSNVQKYYDGNGGSLRCTDSVPIELSSGETVSEIDMTVPVGGDIRGAVLSNGTPAGSAWLYTYIGTYPDGFWLTTDCPGHTGEDGTFLIRHIPEGAVSIYAYPDYGFDPVWWTGPNEPGTPYIDLATLVQVHSGQETMGIDFGLISFNGDNDGDQDVDGQDLLDCAVENVPSGVLTQFAGQYGQQ